LAVTHTIEGKPVPKDTNSVDILPIPIPEDVPLTIKSDIIVVKYFIHVTLDIPFAVDIHANLPFIVTTKKALEQ
jgi:hypothetical protein